MMKDAESPVKNRASNSVTSATSACPCGSPILFLRSGLNRATDCNFIGSFDLGRNDIMYPCAYTTAQELPESSVGNDIRGDSATICVEPWLDML